MYGRMGVKVRINIMYELKIGDSIYTIPKENIRFLAMQQSFDRQDCVALETDAQAIEYLEKVGFEVSDVE